jgi:hypothetical protein
MTNEDPFNHAEVSNNTLEGNETLRQMTVDSANAYSEYLFEKGISDFSVYPEFVPYQGGSTIAHAYINAVIPNQKGYNTFTKEDDYLPPENLFMNYLNSSRISVILSIQPTATTMPVTAVITPDQLVNSNKQVTIDPNNKAKVDIDTTNFVNKLDGANWTS